MPRGGGGSGRDRGVNHRLWDPPLPGNLHQISWEIYLGGGGKQLGSGGPQPAESITEVGAVESGVEQGGCRCPDLGPDLLSGGSVRNYLRVGDVGHGNAHGEGSGRIPPQGGPQADRE